MQGRVDGHVGKGAVVRARGGRSLAWKLVALLGLVLAVTAMILILANHWMARHDLEHRAAVKVQAAAEHVAANLAEDVLRDETRRDRAQALLHYLVDTEPAIEARWTPPDGHGPPESRAGGSFRGDVDADDTVEHRAPVGGTAEAPAFGTIRVREDLRPGYAALTAAIGYHFLLALLGLVGSVAGVYLGADRLVLAPIRRLHDAMVRMAAGGPYDPVEPRGRDEIAELTGQVNRLVGLLISRETENRAAASTLSLVREAVPDVIYRYDVAKDRFEFLSDSVTAQTGCPRDEILKSPRLLLEEMVHPDDRARVRASADGHAAGAGGAVREFRLRRRDGAVRWIEDHSALEFDDQGALVRTSGVMRDITAQKEADEAFRRSEALNRAIAETALDAMLTADEQGRILSANAAVERMLGWRPDELVGRSVVELMPERYRATHGSGLARLAETGEGRVVGRPLHFEALRKDGTEIPVEIAIGVARSPAGQVFTGIVRDLTHQKAVEAQLLHAQKMEAVGTLAGGIAHDFNNILSVIVGHAEMARSRLEDGHRAQRSLEAIVTASQRAADLTARLLGFARSKPRLAHPIDVAQVVQGSLTLLARALDRAIEIRTELQPSLPAILADGSQVEHALMNLCLNARDAMPAGGRLTIVAEAVDLAAGRPPLPPDVAAGRYVRLSVADTGSGMTPDVKARLFEPFFTTKERGRGTGLGLAMVYGVVRGHGGFVEVETAPGRGSRFDLYFPATTEPADPAPEEAPDTAIGGDETILVVDDDDQVRTLLVSMLEAFGYRVVAAADGPTGLALLDATPEIALVVLDMILPGLGGKEVFRRLRATHPHMRVLLSTGYSEQEDAHEILEEGCDGILAKPYLPTALARAVRAILDREGPPSRP